VVAHDAYQGAAVAEFAKSEGVKSVFILNDKEAYGLGVATNFRNAAESLGIKIAGFAAWDPKQSSYEALFRQIGGTGADAVFLGGLIDENGAQVIKDKVAVLGPNDGEVKLFGPDGFTTQQTIDEAGTAAAGMYLSVAGVPIDQFKGAGAEFAKDFEPRLGGKPIDPYAIYGAQAAKVVLAAIAASDGTRPSVIKEVFNASVTDDLLGTFEINDNGDPAQAGGAVVGFTIYKATDKLVTETTLSPKEKDVQAARGT
jgi:branched-chain amino acid transport system substrate-binding protein